MKDYRIDFLMDNGEVSSLTIEASPEEANDALRNIRAAFRSGDIITLENKGTVLGINMGKVQSYTMDKG